MASTYTSSLQIQQIGNGEQSGTWGTTTNTNMALLDQAIAGSATITMSNANHTLTQANGVSDEARNMILEVVGSNSGIYQIVVPYGTGGAGTGSKMYTVYNNTTGGYAITIGYSGGSTVSIPNGYIATVFGDGTNFYSANTTSAGAFYISGTLTAAGTANNYFAGNVVIGSTTPTGVSLRISKNVTGAAFSYGAYIDGAIQSDVTSEYASVQSTPTTQAAAFTLTRLRHFYANQGTIGAGSTVTNQYGFAVENSLTGATNNYGFHSNIAAATGRYNFYANGTADNYFAGNVLIGTTTNTNSSKVVSSGVIESTTGGFRFPDGTTQTSAAVPISEIQSISASVATSALTISASALTIDFRSATLGSGTVTSVTGTPLNLVVPSGATLGTVSATQSRIVVLLLNNAGTMELAVVNIAGGNDLTETGLISTTAISSGSTSASTIYSKTARTSVAYRVVGYVESTQATAGTWATAPSTVQGVGGQALTAMSSLGYGQTWQNVTGSRALSTTYYNTTGRPILVNVAMHCPNGAGASLTVAGVTLIGNVVNENTNNTNGLTLPVCAVIPPGASYVMVVTGGSTIVQWNELR